MDSQTIRLGDDVWAEVGVYADNAVAIADRAAKTTGQPIVLTDTMLARLNEFWRLATTEQKTS